MRRIKKVLSISISKTLLVNYRYFGFVDVGIFDKKYERSIWDNNGIFQFEGSAHFG